MNLCLPQFLPPWAKEVLRLSNELTFADLRPVPPAYSYCTSIFKSVSTGQMCKTSLVVCDVAVVAQCQDQKEDQELSQLWFRAILLPQFLQC